MSELIHEAAKIENLKDIFRLYPDDGGNNVGTPSEDNMKTLTQLLEEWIKQFTKARDDYGARPFENSDDLVNYARAERLLKDVERMHGEASTFSKVQSAATQIGEEIPITADEYKAFQKKYDAFTPPNDGNITKVALPKELPAFTAPPSRAEMVSMQYDIDNSILPPVQDKKPRENDSRLPTVKQVFESKEPFAEALAQSNGGNKAEAKANIEKGFRKLAEKAYDTALSQDDDRYEKKNERGELRDQVKDKQQFVDAFVESHDITIKALQKKVDSTNPSAHESLEHDLANLTLVSAHPEAVIKGVKTDLKGKLITDTNVKGAAVMLSADLAILDAERMHVRHMAGMNGQDFNASLAAGSKATSEIIQGKDAQTVIAENKEKYPVKEDTSDLGRRKKAAGYLVQAEAILDSGRPVSMEALTDSNHPDHKASTPQIFNFHAARSDQMRSLMTNPDVLRLNEADTTKFAEMQAEERMGIASRQQMRASEESLATTFGPEGKTAMQQYLQSERPAGLNDGQTIEKSEARLKYSREQYDVSKAINKDPALKEIALAAMSNAPEGQDPAKYALDQVKEAQKLPDAGRKQLAETMLKKQIDKDGDGKISKDETTVYMAERLGLGANLTPEKAGERIATKFDANHNGQLDYEERQALQTKLGGESGIFAQVLKDNGADLKDITKTLQKNGVGEAVPTAVSKDTGMHAEGQNTPTILVTKQTEESLASRH